MEQDTRTTTDIRGSYELKQEEKRKKMQTFQRGRMMRRLALWTGILLLVVGGVYGMVKLVSSSKVPSAVLTETISVTDWVKGNRNSKVVLIEYSDFQCPACGAYYPIVKRVTEEFGDKIAFVYRHFPLQQHRNARIASYAAEAAGKQGKFFEMHDKIFESQAAWSESLSADEAFAKFAGELGLDLEQYKNDSNSSEVKARIDQSYQSGVRSSVNATPTFFLNGKQIQPRGYDDFKAIINNELTTRS
ncbi:MAG: DsbA family protein [Parcubacteria group bacterium]|nr:DsbA family protein [Parcubacteria group bacterium]